MTKTKRRGSTDRNDRRSRSPYPGKLTNDEIKAIKARHRDDEKKKDKKARKKELDQLEKRLSKKFKKKKKKKDSADSSSSSVSSDSDSDSDSGASYHSCCNPESIPVTRV